MRAQRPSSRCFMARSATKKLPRRKCAASFFSREERTLHFACASIAYNHFCQQCVTALACEHTVTKQPRCLPACAIGSMPRRNFLQSEASPTCVQNLRTHRVMRRISLPDWRLYNLKRRNANFRFAAFFAPLELVVAALGLVLTLHAIETAATTMRSKRKDRNVPRPSLHRARTSDAAWQNRDRALPAGTCKDTRNTASKSPETIVAR